MKLRQKIYLSVVITQLLTIFLIIGTTSAVESYFTDREGFNEINTVNSNHSDKSIPEPEKPTKLNGPGTENLPYLLKRNKSVFTDGYHHKIPLYHVKTNNKGFREDNFPKKPAENKTRVVVVGDSYTFGWGLNRSDLFTHLTERKLNEDGNYEVLNLGIPGFGMRDYYYLIKERAINYQPDIIVVVFKSDDKLSTKKALDLRQKAASLIPENTSSRTKKIKAKQAELQEELVIDMDIRKSNIPVYMNKSRKLAEKNNTEIIFYNIHPFGNEDYYKHLNSTTKSRIFLPPEKIRENGWGEYRLTDYDVHPNSKASELIADKLYEIIHNISENK
jgi:lysophospholipase L1-like esterase